MARRSTQRSNPTRDRTAPALAQSNDRAEPPIPLLSVRLRVLLSTAIAYHLMAVFIGAWIGSPPTSPFADQVVRPFRAYIAAADLNHGYRFFAPNPGPSHLFRYQLTFADGSTQDGYFPSRTEHWPRLLYHRYFMLSENLNILRPRSPTAEDQAAIEEEALQPFRAMAQSYAAQLLRAWGAAQIDWQVVRHYQPAPADVLAGRPLTHDDYYEPLERGSLKREEQ
ncbi:MAG: hypothetical protein WD894_19970 [Pirellulales bacterium]